MIIRFGQILKIRGEQRSFTVIDIGEGNNFEAAASRKMAGRLSLGIPGGLNIEHMEGVVGQRVLNQIVLMYMLKFEDRKPEGIFYDELRRLASKREREI